MNDTKSFLLSKTLWGAVIASLPVILGLLGYKVSDIASFSSGAEQTVDAVITLIGSALAIWGRVKATTALVIKKV